MYKEMFKYGFFLLCFMIILASCNKEKASNDPEKEETPSYKEFDAVAEEFFIAYQIKDYDTMKKYLSESQIEDSVELSEAGKGVILHPEYKAIIKGKYKITATDFYYKSNNQVIYLFNFYDPASGIPSTFGIFGIEKREDQYLVMNNVDFVIHGVHFNKETGNSYLRISTLKKLMEKYPDNVYEVKTHF